jgi:pilus assembly protein CpaF
MAVPKKLVAQLTSTVRDALSSEALRRSNADETKLTLPARKALAASVLQAELKRIDQQQIANKRPRMVREDELALIAEVLAETTGLGQIEMLLADPTVEDICFTKFDCGFTDHSDGTRRRVDMKFDSDAAMKEWVSYMANTKGGTGRSFNSQQPILVLQIGDGLRLAATCEVSEHTTFSLRRNTLGEVSIENLVRLGMFPESVGDLLRALIKAPEMRIVIVGATGAGKTTLVRAMLNELDELVRVGIVEDTREIGLRDDVKHPNVESFEVREANLQGEGKISMGDLVSQLFRYRVDKLIVGEVRGADAAVPMLHAMTNGMASLTTTHEHTARGGLEKLAEMLAQGTESSRGMDLGLAKIQVARAVDIAIHVDRGVNGRRFVSEIVEVAGHEGDQILTQQVYAADYTGKQTAMSRISTPLVSDKLRRAGYRPASKALT